jgi:hypothetical protein
MVSSCIMQTSHYSGNLTSIVVMWPVWSVDMNHPFDLYIWKYYRSWGIILFQECFPLLLFTSFHGNLDIYTRCLVAVTITMEAQSGATGTQSDKYSQLYYLGSSFNILIWFPSGVMHYAGLIVHREFVIHVLFGRTEISYEVTLDI